jgi:hypothetical protein
VNSDSIQDAQEDISKIQGALEEAQEVLQAAHRVREATERAHEAAEQHAEMLRTVSMIAIGVIVVAALLGFRRRRQPPLSATFLRDEILARLNSEPTVHRAS